MIEKPIRKVADLKGDTKKIMITLIREFSKDLFKETGLGLEGTEEVLTEIIDKGSAKVSYNEEQGRFYLGYYDHNTQSYIVKGKE